MATLRVGVWWWSRLLNEDSLLHIVDRAKDIVITGDFNVYATEAEGR